MNLSHGALARVEEGDGGEWGACDSCSTSEWKGARVGSAYSAAHCSHSHTYLLNILQTMKKKNQHFLSCIFLSDVSWLGGQTHGRLAGVKTFASPLCVRSWDFTPQQQNLESEFRKVPFAEECTCGQVWAPTTERDCSTAIKNQAKGKTNAKTFLRLS